MPGDARWLGQLTPRGIPLVVGGRLADTSVSFFAILGDGRLRSEGALIDPLLPWQRVRVVGLLGKAWQVDPSVEQEQLQLWHLWLWEGRALSELDWDPGEWRWPEVVADQGPSPFFAYSAKLGRSILGRMQSRPPT